MMEAHGRFGAWLTAGADGDPPRDLAVHASVCAGCRQSIAALDLLIRVDPGLAGIPPLVPFRPPSPLVRAGRLASVGAGVVIGAVILGVGASQLIAGLRGGPPGPVAVASPTPDQGILAGTQTPAPTSSPVPSTSVPSSVGTLSPLPTSRPTARPTPRPTSAPTPVPIPTETPLPTVTPTAPSAPQSLQAFALEGSVELTWQPPASDGGDPNIVYNVYRWDALQPQSVVQVGFGEFGIFFEDLNATPGTTWYYVVTAVNGFGESVWSEPASATPTAAPTPSPPVAAGALEARLPVADLG